jgi:hypothetical protein
MQCLVSSPTLRGAPSSHRLGAFRPAALENDPAWHTPCVPAVATPPFRPFFHTVETANGSSPPKAARCDPACRLCAPMNRNAQRGLATSCQSIYGTPSSKASREVSQGTSKATPPELRRSHPWASRWLPTSPGSRFVESPRGVAPILQPPVAFIFDVKSHPLSTGPSSGANVARNCETLGKTCKQIYINENLHFYRVPLFTARQQA